MFERLIFLIKIVFSDFETIKEARFSDNFFSRERKISFTEFLIFIFNHPICSTTIAISRFLGGKRVREPISKQAVCRKKTQISEWPFKKAFKICVKELYSSVNKANLKKIFGYYPVAIDGSEINLPRSEELRNSFGTTGRGGINPSARASLAFDVINGFILDALLVPIKVGERALCKSHIREVLKLLGAKESLFIMDRGYPATDLIRMINSSGAKFVMRVRKKFNLAIDDAPCSSVVELDGMKVRVEKFTLESGEVETIITNLFDLDYQDLYEIYSLRWGVEENYKTVKNRLHLESFTGYLPQVILQDFWVVILHDLLLQAIANEADQKIQRKESDKYCYQANRSVIAGKLRDSWKVFFLGSEEEIKRQLEEIIFLASRDKIPIRPGRHFNRRTPQKTKYHMNYKFN